MNRTLAPRSTARPAAMGASSITVLTRMARVGEGPAMLTERSSCWSRGLCWWVTRTADFGRTTQRHTLSALNALQGERGYDRLETTSRLPRFLVTLR
jgi:hypothetical protein